MTIESNRPGRIVYPEISGRALLAATAAALVFASGPALAAGKGGTGSSGGGSAAGVVIIDQARAEAGGVTADDLPGFPVTISEPGSYRLVGNLGVSDAFSTAIEITSGNVTLDLDGFTIAGPVTCMPGPMGYTVCSETGTGDGILLNPPGLNYRAAITVMNGTIRGMGRVGIYNSNAADGVRVERVMTLGNGSAGIVSVHGITIVDSQLSYNGVDGVRGNSVALLNNVIRNNGSYGVRTNMTSAGALNVIQDNPTNVTSGGMRYMGPNWCGAALCQ